MGWTSPCGDGRGWTLGRGGRDPPPIVAWRGWTPCYRAPGVGPAGLDPRCWEDGGWAPAVGSAAGCWGGGGGMRLPLRSVAGYLGRWEAFLHPRLAVEVLPATRILGGLQATVVYRFAEGGVYLQGMLQSLLLCCIAGILSPI